MTALWWLLSFKTLECHQHKMPLLDGMIRKLFLRICLEEINAKSKPKTHFSKEGWEKKIQKIHDKIQLKIRQDKQTIIANKEWWIIKIRHQCFF